MFEWERNRRFHQMKSVLVFEGSVKTASARLIQINYFKEKGLDGGDENDEE